MCTHMYVCMHKCNRSLKPNAIFASQRDEGALYALKIEYKQFTQAHRLAILWNNSTSSSSSSSSSFSSSASYETTIGGMRVMSSEEGALMWHSLVPGPQVCMSVCGCVCVTFSLSFYLSLS